MTPKIGNRTNSADAACSTVANDKVISNVKNSIRGTYHSISKKYLPRYLAEFCFKFNWRFNLKKTFEQLIYSCIRTAPIPEYLLKLAEIRW
ncbi:transposase [Photorhabdus laumondii]|uniref:transposase n=1 Tax=Photorhabdus laumondii TaxID=2218628 RepID=UPI003314D624